MSGGPMAIIKPEMKSYIWLETADGSIQEVEEEVAMFCPVICKELLQNGKGSSKNCAILLPERVNPANLELILEFCRFHQVPGRSNKERKKHDEKFVRLDTRTLCDLASAADSLQLRPVVDLTSRALARVIEGKTPEEIRETFHLPDDLTEEEKLEPLRNMTDDPRIRLLNRLYARKRKELCERKKLKNVEVEEERRVDERSVDDLLSFINSGDQDSKGVRVTKNKKKSRGRKEQARNLSSNNEAGNYNKESNCLTTGCRYGDTSNGSSPSKSSKLQSSPSAMFSSKLDFDDFDIDDELDPARKEEIDREVEDFARRLDSVWPERIQQILSLGQDRRRLKPISMNGNGSLPRCTAGMAEVSGMFTVQQTIGNVLCCKCGISMQPNAANMCAKCLRSEVDITEGLQKHVVIVHCPECDSYLQPPRSWIKAQLESKELLTFCIKRLKNLNKVKLVNAEFIWTEPHSKRIKVRLKVRKEVLNGAVLEQSYIVEYVVQDQMCESCSKEQVNPDQWVAAVQLRQHVSHRRTFFYLEQLILKHDAANRAVKIQQLDQGIDFFFGHRSHALKFMDFVSRVVLVRTRNGKQLVSHDHKSNIVNYKYTFSVEICPVCREDLICLPPKVAASLGNIGPLVICTKVSNSIALLDPFTLRHCFLDADQYWRASFKPLLTSRQLVEYVVLDVDVVSEEVNIGGSKYALADIQVARVSDFGKNDTIFSIRTHLGHLLDSGDYALGYDLYGTNSNDFELEKYKGLVLPEVILIKKSYEEKRQKKRGKPRSWKLKSLNMEVDHSGKGRDEEEKMNSEYEEFLRDLEENPDLRFNISLYRDKEYQRSETTSVADGEDVPSIPLEELLADIDLRDIDAEEDD